MGVGVPGKKRKSFEDVDTDDEYSLNEVSSSSKREEITIHNSARNHPYDIKSPRGLKRQVDDLIDKLENKKET